MLQTFSKHSLVRGSILSIVLNFWVVASSQSVDSIACKIFEKNLQIVELAIKDVNLDPHLDRINAVQFLMNLTNLPYEGKVTFIGREFPSNKFLLKCTAWYKKNRQKLIWDPSLNAVIIN